MDSLVRVENVSKKFCRGLRRSMWYGLRDIARNAVGLRSGSGALRRDEFWALRGIDFELKRGEVLGVIGPNGSGKSTLLKMLNGIYWPDAGRIAVAGRVGALIEVGAGFHPMLSGRENIYVNGAILGMSKKEIEEKFDEIVAFADIGDFLDTSVKKYSSGMFVRLGFAVAAHCSPDVLLIDEILAVGDEGFRNKCYNSIDNLISESAVVFVSHNMETITRICTKVMVLNKSNIIFYGDPIEAVASYSKLFNQSKELLTKDDSHKVLRFQIVSDSEIPFGGSIRMQLILDCPYQYSNIILRVNILSSSGEICAEFNNDNIGVCIDLPKGISTLSIRMDDLLLLPRQYFVTVLVINRPADHLFWYRNVGSFSIEGRETGIRSYQLLGNIALSNQNIVEHQKITNEI